MITRENYDEFFMLYVDNELSPAERRIVEAFVAGNADLKAELDILLQCRLDPESGLVFENRESLLKKSPVANNPLPHEESLLLYIDGELDEDARRSVENHCRQNPSMLSELTLWQQTLIEPDTALVFRNRAVLYKKESDRRIVFLPFFRIAAAASLLLAIGLLIFYIAGKDHPGVTPAPADSLNLVTSLPRVKKSQQLRTSQQVSDSQQVKNSQQENKNGLVKQSVAGGQPARIKNAPKAVSRQVNTKLAELADNNTGVAVTTIPIDRKLTDPGNNSIDLTDRAVPELDAGDTKGSSFATEALHDESIASATAHDDDADAGDDDTGPAAPKKNKLRGVFRKVSRVFEKNANRDDDDRRGILIGNLQIALK
jgi:anti-sigma factor RsiW